MRPHADSPRQILSTPGSRDTSLVARAREIIGREQVDRIIDVVVANRVLREQL
ncbi:MAG: hypothetical protein H6765_01910 [Candidatus Peribacteria bacterium]|nr:MAG: hypothetical protein H6765_01910 [Candidatus Peribacteria bacterium]